MIKRTSYGFTFFEALVAIGIVGITAGAMMLFHNYLGEQTANIFQKAELLKVLVLIDYDIHQEIDFIPTRVDEGIDYIYSDSLDFEKLKQSFISSEVFSRCYSNSGEKVPKDDPKCEIFVEYYKVPELDRIYGVGKNSEFNSSTIGRIVYRIMYKEKTTNKQVIHYFCRLKANVLSF